MEGTFHTHFFSLLINEGSDCYTTGKACGNTLFGYGAGVKGANEQILQYIPN